MKEKAICRPEIEEYLPHKASMLFLDRLVDWDVEACCLEAEIDVRADRLLYNDELAGIPAWVGFEYMAQSIAALSGVHARTVLDSEPKIGFIMSVRAFETSVPAYPAGKTLRSRVSQLYREGSVVSFECAVFMDGRAVTTAVINAIETDDPRTLIGD